MTDTPDVDVDVEAEGWHESSVSYPEQPDNPHNHAYTLSLTPKEPPFLVVRGSTPDEIKGRLDELETSGTMAAIGAAWTAYKGHTTMGAGLGPTTPVPPPPGPSPVAQQVAAAYPTPAPVPPAPPAPAPAGWQGGGQQGSNRDPKPRPPWPQVYRISIARGDASFKQYREANQQYFKGKVQWAGGGDYWIHGEVVQSVAQWNPVPA